MPLSSQARIIALCGDEGVGKSYLAAQSGRKIVSFADGLREIVSVMTGIPAADMKKQSIKNMPLSLLAQFGEANGNIRDLLIATGNMLRSYNDDYFIIDAFERMKEGRIIIDDLRFSHEATSLRETFGDELEIIRVTNGDTSTTHADKYGTIVADRVYVNEH